MSGVDRGLHFLCVVMAATCVAGGTLITLLLAARVRVSGTAGR